jgi:hypothetical protein
LLYSSRNISTLFAVVIEALDVHSLQRPPDAPECVGAVFLSGTVGLGVNHRQERCSISSASWRPVRVRSCWANWFNGICVQ